MPTRRNRSSIFVGTVVGLGISACLSGLAVSAQSEDKHPVVVLETSMGAITIELDKEKAPITVENFLKYVDGGFYDNLIFHRVMSDFMIQGGGFDQQMHEKTEGQRGEIKNESGNGLSNKKGTIAMARLPAPDSAQNQFFINVEDNERLDTSGGGYAVFGKVTDGMDVVNKIRRVKTTTRAGMANVPVDPVIIKTARRKAKK
ncbi:MAG TPA: peptidylprolyl isomerase [Isosphaeraceae bacterium]|nr:peptidylprolyl isomerase [Isosphaeraceae bacterium]